MNVGNFLNNVKIVENKELLISCPSCGSECSVNDLTCSNCGYSLDHYKGILFSHYSYFDEAIDFFKAKDYFAAIISISKYLAFSPNDVEANKMYIYLLHINGQEEKYQHELELFEKKFVKNSWIMQIETKGIDSYVLPDKKNLNVPHIDEALSVLNNQYLDYRIKTTQDIIDFTQYFFDIVRYYSYKEKESKLLDFYQKKFLLFLSKKEISVNQNNGKKIDDLSNEELGLIDIIATEANSNFEDGTLITVYPCIQLRSSIISKEKVICIRNDKKGNQEVINKEKSIGDTTVKKANVFKVIKKMSKPK